MAFHGHFYGIPAAYSGVLKEEGKRTMKVKMLWRSLNTDKVVLKQLVLAVSGHRLILSMASVYVP